MRIKCRTLSLSLAVAFQRLAFFHVLYFFTLFMSLKPAFPSQASTNTASRSGRPRAAWTWWRPRRLSTDCGWMVCAAIWRTARRFSRRRACKPMPATTRARVTSNVPLRSRHSDNTEVMMRYHLRPSRCVTVTVKYEISLCKGQRLFLSFFPNTAVLEQLVRAAGRSRKAFAHQTRNEERKGPGLGGSMAGQGAKKSCAYMQRAGLDRARRTWAYAAGLLAGSASTVTPVSFFLRILRCSFSQRR